MQNFTQENLVTPELFDSLQEWIIWLKPIVLAGEVTGFEVSYCSKSKVFIPSLKQKMFGAALATGSVINENRAPLLFKQCLQVWATGLEKEDALVDGLAELHYRVRINKVKDGVLYVISDITQLMLAKMERLGESVKLNSVLEASADGVMLLEAIRNEEGKIVDFRFIHCNKAAFRLGKFAPTIIGKTLLEILPHLQRSEQLELHKKVVETGVPVRLETTFRNENGEEYGWFIVSLMKTGDSVVSTFTDISEKKKNEEKIEDQTDLLNSIFDASINAIFALEAIKSEQGEIIDLKIVKINGTFTFLLGVSAQDAEENTYLTLFPPAKDYGFFAMYCGVIETGESRREELFYDDGKVTGWFDVSAVKRGSDGIVVTFTNITEAKRNKEALEESARYMQDVIDSSQTGILLLTPVVNQQNDIEDFRFKTVNRTVAAFAGKEPGELKGKLHSGVFPQREGSLIDRYKQFVTSGESEQRFENHFTVNGNDVWLDVLVKKSGEDLLITFHDFSPLKKLQVEIAEAAHKLNIVINNSQAGLFTLKPLYNEAGEIEDFRFGIVNQSVAAYIGETAETLTGSLASTYFPASKANGLFEIYRETYLTNKQHQFDFHYEGGFEAYFDIHTAKTDDEVLVTFTDHTSLKRLQIQLQALVEDLKHSNSNLEEFAYAASHDLQEPLRKIHYFSERLRKAIAPKLSEEESRMFERIESASKRMSQLINDLLIYSQITTINKSFSLVDLEEIVQQVMGDLETSVSEKKATITTEALPKIIGDPLQISQMFQNILGNSLKYSKGNEPPHVTIKGGIVSKVSGGATKKFHNIVIKDNGIGFEQEHAERIFKIFHRLHGQNEFPGTGIGLAIVQKVIDNHNGVIRAEGQPGKGATFTILLPFTEKG